MSSERSTCATGKMRGLAVDAIAQARKNAENALRVLAMAPRNDCGVVPHPVIVAEAEIRNILLYLAGDNQ